MLQAGVSRADLYAVLMTLATGEDLADPSRIPSLAEHHVELRGEDRARAVAAACLRHDAARVAELAGKLAGDPRRRAARVCAGAGIDLPR
jgi:hypothetical protein